MSFALLPWETCSVPDEIQKELVRRKTNRSFNYKKIDGWSSDGGSWEQYKGPQRAWARLCSNGIGHPELNKKAFILSGGKGFYQTYGFKSNQQGNQQVLGYTPNGELHTVDNDINSQYPIHVPVPEIVRVEAIIQKELFRRVFVHWTCFSAKQLEYMTPYFLVPGMTMIVEWGWNNFNPASLIDLTDESKLSKYYFQNPYPLYNENVLKSNGNYDVIFGLVTNYEWSIEGNKINCMTEITSKDRLYAGVPISTVVAENQPDDKENPTKYFQNLKQLCETDFIKLLPKIAKYGSLKVAEEKLANVNSALLETISRGSKEGKREIKQEYWRGVFYGRDNDLIEKVNKFTPKEKTNAKLDIPPLEPKWIPSPKGDFDNTPGDDNNVWINMGFLVELINRSLPTPTTTENPFFEVNVDEAVIGAHPNLISTDGSILLIPNKLAPKYMWGNAGLQQNGVDSDYAKQFKMDATSRGIKREEDKNDPLWHADYQLHKVCKHQITNIYRDDIDRIINMIRYQYLVENGRPSYSFPFSSEVKFPVKNRDKEATYDPYFYGFFKDLYFNVKRFVEIVKDQNTKTYVDLYQSIFSDMNKASGNFWEFALVPNDNSSGLTVVDKKMLPSGNNRATPWYFDFMDTDQLMLNLGFKPKMTDAQAFRAIFGETNNSGSKTIVKEENDLLDYKFDDRILIKNRDESATLISEKPKDPYRELIKIFQTISATPAGCYQFTTEMGDKKYYRRLALPDSGLLNCLLDDNDLERNQRYTGIQPITVEVGLQGIGGLRTFMTFLIRNLPKPYFHKDVAYRIVDVHHVLQDGKWDTVIKAGILPLRSYIKQKIGITE